MTNKQIATTIINQLGGAGRLKAMLNVKQFTYNKDGQVSFRFSGYKKANVCRIRLNGADLYDIEFEKFVPSKLTKEFEWTEEIWKTVSVHTDIYNDQLKDLFEQETGLYLSL